MAKQKHTTGIGKVATVDYSTQISSMVVSYSVEELDTTAFGDTAKRREGGLTDGSVSINWKFNADLTNKNTISGLLGTVVAIVFRSDGAAASATNPELQFNALVTSVPDWGGAVGTLDEVTTTWPIDSTITFAV